MRLIRISLAWFDVVWFDKVDEWAVLFFSSPISCGRVGESVKIENERASENARQMQITGSKEINERLNQREMY